MWHIVDVNYNVIESFEDEAEAYAEIAYWSDEYTVMHEEDLNY